jgi:hypothetical protein
MSAICSAAASTRPVPGSFADIPQGLRTYLLCPRLCCKSRKSIDSKNFAKVDFWIFPALRGSVQRVRRFAVVLSTNDVVPSRLCVRNASAGLENFVRQPQKTLATVSPRKQTSEPSSVVSALDRAEAKKLPPPSMPIVRFEPIVADLNVKPWPCGMRS